MRVYVGTRDADGVASVEVDGRPLNPRLDLWSHSPSGLEWGYGGSGPAQLALAILAQHLGAGGPQTREAREAVRLHQDFKWMVTAGLPRAGWSLSGEEVAQHLAELRAGREVEE
jgi:hypothetical protein